MIYVKVVHAWKSYYAFQYKFRRFAFYRTLKYWYCPNRCLSPTNVYRSTHEIKGYDEAVAFAKTLTREYIETTIEGSRVEALIRLDRIQHEMEREAADLRAKGIVLKT